MEPVSTQLKILPPTLDEIEAFLDSHFSEIPLVKPFSNEEISHRTSLLKAVFVSGYSVPELEDIVKILFDPEEPNYKTALPLGMFCYLVNNFLSMRTGTRLSVRAIRKILRDSSPRFFPHFRLGIIRDNSSSFHVVCCPYLREWYVGDLGRPVFFDPLMKIKLPYPLFPELPEFLQKEIQLLRNTNTHLYPAWREKYLNPSS